MLDDTLAACIRAFAARVAGGDAPGARSWPEDLQHRARLALARAGIGTARPPGDDPDPPGAVRRLPSPDAARVPRTTQTAPSEDPHIFLCYPSEYRDEVRQVATLLEAAGLPVWYDDKLLAERWDLAVERRIRSCSVLVLLVGPRVRQAERTEHIASEVGLAQSLGKPVLPVLFSAGRELPEGLGLKLVNLARLHCTDLADPAFHRELTERLRPYVNGPGAGRGGGTP